MNRLKVNIFPQLKLSERGYTLVELSIAVLASGILIAMTVAAFNTAYTKYLRYLTQTRLAQIEEAISDYVLIYGHLPCVAPIDVPTNNAAFGVETNCSAAPVPGTIDTPGRAGMSVRIGGVPTKTFQDMYTNNGFNSTKISHHHAYDGWGRRFTMAVTASMAVDMNGYLDNKGAIGILDTNGNSLTSPGDHGLYVVISHGHDGFGARAQESGVVYLACSATGLDVENCDGDAAFRRSTLFSQSGTAANLDDLVVFTVKEHISTPAITDFTNNTLFCDPTKGVGLNEYGDNCATVKFNNQDIYINPPAEKPSDGLLLYSYTFTAKNDGRVIVRAAIPIRVMASGWRPPIMASIYLNGLELPNARGLVFDPSETIHNSGGGTGVLIASDLISKGTAYTVSIYLFSLDPDITGGAAFAGAVKTHDHAVEAVIEVMESGK